MNRLLVLIISHITLFLLPIASYADYSGYSKEILNEQAGIKIQSSYKEGYLPILRLKFNDYTFSALEKHMNNQIKNITEDLYHKTLEQLSSDIIILSGNIPNDYNINKVKSCLYSDFDNNVIPQVCLPARLWEGAYRQYSLCASKKLQMSFRQCTSTSFNLGLYSDSYFDTRFNIDFASITHDLIDLSINEDFKNISRTLYAIAVDKIFYDLRYMTSLSDKEKPMKLLRECINNNANFDKVYEQCKASNLWYSGFKSFADCTSSDLEKHFKNCLDIKI